MFDFLQDADVYLTTFWYIAIPVSLLFVIQLIMTFVGIDADTEIDSEVNIGDTDGFMEYFTIRNAINFLLGFSWTGVLMHGTISSKFLLILASVAVGIIFVTLYFYLALQIKKIEEDNTFNPVELIGFQADVYLRIPGKQEGSGKIIVSHKGTMHELEAVTYADAIPTGSKVIIEDLQDNNMLIVNVYK